METIQESVKETANKMIFSGKSIDFGVKVFEKQLEQLKKYVVRGLRGEYNAAVVGIGNNQLRRELLRRLQSYGYRIPVLIHPTAYVSQSAKIGKGTVVEPKAIVNTGSQVGEGCIISAGAIVDHDVILEECVHVNTGAICKAGSVVVATIKLEVGQLVMRD